PGRTPPRDKCSYGTNPAGLTSIAEAPGPSLYARSVPRQKRVSASRLDPELQRLIDAVLSGDATSLRLPWRLAGTLNEVPNEIRELTGLRSLDLQGSYIDSLPAWLGDLPHLEEVDIRRTPITELPLLPTVRWGISAEVAARVGDVLDPAMIV